MDTSNDGYEDKIVYFNRYRRGRNLYQLCKDEENQRYRLRKLLYICSRTAVGGGDEHESTPAQPIRNPANLTFIGECMAKEIEKAQVSKKKHFMINLHFSRLINRLNLKSISKDRSPKNHLYYDN